MGYNGADLIFPHIGIVIERLPRSVSVFGIEIAFYGIIIAIGMLVALFVTERVAVARGEDPDIYYDLFIVVIATGIIGARLYYCIFRWDLYKDDLLSVLRLREGGLAIYGGIIMGALSTYIFSRIKKVPVLRLTDGAVYGLLTGQIIGRYGNFFNCEAFGGYTDSLLAMRIKESLVNPSMISSDLLSHIITDDGIRYIQVHPTFLYESVWNLLSLILLLVLLRRDKLGSGRSTFGYLLLYGIGRCVIEGLRTDQLLVPGTGLAVSRLVSLACIALAALFFFYRSRLKR